MYSTCYSCQVLIKLVFSQQIFQKYPNIDFHENPSSESRVVPCGRADGRTDTRKLIVSFRNFANTHEKGAYCCVRMATVITRTRHTVTYAQFYLVEIISDGLTRNILKPHFLYHKSHILPGNLTITRRITTDHPQINDSFLDQLDHWTAVFRGS